MTAGTDKARTRLFDIIKQKSFVRGHVVLASGKESDHYFNMKPSMLDPEGATLLGSLLLDKIEGVQADGIGGLEMGAVPLVAPIAVESFRRGKPIPGFFVRKAQKGYGAQKQIEGMNDVKGKRLVIVEDVTTTGGSAMKALDVLKEAGAQIVMVISILDREEGAVDLYREAGIPFAYLFQASEFLRG
jgi:orotate phosphoribosyltransferase